MKEDKERLTDLENAIIQINHFTEAIETLDLPSWKAEVSNDIKWIKYLMGATVVAGIARLVLGLLGI